VSIRIVDNYLATASAIASIEKIGRVHDFADYFLIINRNVSVPFGTLGELRPVNPIHRPKKRAADFREERSYAITAD